MCNKKQVVLFIYFLITILYFRSECAHQLAFFERPDDKDDKADDKDAG